MADYIRPTPRNPVLGLLADVLTGGVEWMRDPRRAQQMQGLGGLLAETGIPATMERLSYGEPLTTGRGMTTRLRPEAEAALMTLGPEAVPIGRGAMAAVRATKGLPVGAATVYHGSPYRFQRFNPTKIGSGEGAQAYGYGHYVAESPAVARQYAENVKDMGSVQRINAELSRLSKIMNADEVPGAYRKYRSDEGRKASEQYDALMAQREQVRTAPGALYTIDLPDTAIARMLDWDKPLSEQPENVREALKVLDPFVSKSGEKMWGELAYPGFASTPTESPQAAAQWLRQQGIPGIRYLDQGSRGAGQGTSNFVVFPGEEDLLRILSVNGGLLGP